MEPNVEQIPPEQILADDNSRFSLKKLRIEALAESILEQGRIHTPCEVEPLATPVNGCKYKLTVGHYRHAAALKLNQEQNAGLTVPCIVFPIGDGVERLKRQLSENMDRENQSPMDKAVAIQKLMGAGVPKVEIRKIFSTPGGRKGLTMQMASNSFINMTLSFLELPKAIQEKIHDGRVGVAAAYKLTKVTPDQRLAVLEEAERERLKAVEAEEKEETKFLEQEAKAAKEQEKADAAAKELEAKKAQHELAIKEAEEKAVKAGELYKAKAAKLKDAEAKAAAEKAFKDAENEVRIAEKVAEAAKKELDRVESKVQTAAEHAKERAAKLKAARKEADKETKTVKPADVDKAAKKLGASTNYVPLNATEMRKFIADMALPGGNPKTMAVGEIIKSVFAGISTDKQGFKKLNELLSDKSKAKSA